MTELHRAEVGPTHPAHGSTSGSPSGARTVCVVIPMHNEAPNLHAVVDRLVKVAGALHGWKLEVLFVDDGSRDNSVEVLRQIRASGIPVGCLRLSRNYGHQSAIYAGMAENNADVVITMDADLQHPPEDIAMMLQAHDEGVDVVQLVRDLPQSGGKGIFSTVFYKVFNRISETPIIPDAPDFRLISRRVLDVLIRIPERDKFLRGLIPSLGFKQITMPYTQAERLHGTPSFSFKKSLRLANKALFGYSTIPLKLVFWFGLSISMLSFAGGFLFVIIKLIEWHSAEPGFTDLIFAITFLSGCILLSIGILGRYLMMILEQVRGRPTHIIWEHLPPGPL